MVTKSKSKKCFVIAPIGEAGSPTRKRSDKIFNHIIQPIVEDAGYSAERADKMNHPGMITNQIIDHIMNVDLVIADLTDHNPNVFYELAIRHAVHKPIIQLIQDNQKLPFDISDSRTIFVDHTDLDSVYDCKENLKKQIISLEENPEKIESPISHAIDIQKVMQKNNSDSFDINDLFVLFKELRSDIQEIKLQQSNSLRHKVTVDKIKELPIIFSSRNDSENTIKKRIGKHSRGDLGLY